MKTTMLTITTMIILTLALNVEARDGNNRRKPDREQNPKVEAFREQQKAENEAFRATVKEMEPDARLAAVIAHREKQHTEALAFHASLHQERMAKLNERFEKGDRLTDAQKADLISFFETQHKENVAFHTEWHEASIAQIESSSELGKDERKKAMTAFRKKLKQASQAHKQEQHKETRAKMSSIRGDRQGRNVGRQTNA
jgi:hypothetical protein